MAKKKTQSKQSWQVEFASIKLDAEGKKSFLVWYDEATKQGIDPLLDFLGDDWKISFSFDAEHDTYIASVTQKDEDDRNYNICCVSRSDNPIEALYINWYKIYVLFNKKRLPTEPEMQNWG